MAFSMIVTVGLFLTLKGVVGHESHNDRFVVDKDHLKEDLHRIMPEENFDFNEEEQMNFHYFKVHDLNKDNKLDGLEIAASFNDNEGSHDDSEEPKRDMSDEDLDHLLKQILAMSDINDDGYVDFFEFVESQKKYAA